MEIEARDQDLTVLKYPTPKFARELTDSKTSECHIEKKKIDGRGEGYKDRTTEEVAGKICEGKVAGEKL